jgi:hypothetical protein
MTARWRPDMVLSIESTDLIYLRLRDSGTKTRSESGEISAASNLPMVWGVK